MGFCLSTPLSELKGVGQKRLEALGGAGLKTVQDLLFRFPSSYRSGKIYPLSPERVGHFSYFALSVESTPSVVRMKGKGATLRYIAKDESGRSVSVLHVHQPYLKNKIQKGAFYYFGGILQERNGSFYLFSPLLEKEKPREDLLSPVYPSVAGLSSKVIASLIDQFLTEVLSEVEETIPLPILETLGFMPRARAVYLLHRPPNEAFLENAKERFAFEGLFRFSVQATLFSREQNTLEVPAFEKRDLTEFFAALPFSLTDAQTRVIGEIADDLCGTGLVSPMDRLLQGDVGSGKTVVAAAAAYLAAQNGKSTLVMAPTEILATQHFHSFTKLFAPLSVPVYLITGSTGKKERDIIFEKTTGDTPYILIGTHALIEESTRCGGVALAITDEQHRFGVRHRNRLSQKGEGVHSLVMSATPIPRSLAMFLHAKSRISVIDQLPPGRKEITTLYVGEDKLPRVYTFLKEKIALGQQAYVVCPLIEDEEGESPLISAADELEEIKKFLPEVPCSLLHGKMKPAEKERVMEEFKSGKTSLLVSTTVIEVGVDVPSATVMVIRCAERFGLSQLHQLRGRVGRGTNESFCILVSSHSSLSARKRLNKLCTCHDGFELARFDLKTRGPGEFFGTRQSGFDAPLPHNYTMELIGKASEAAALFLDSATDEELTPFIQTLRMN